MSEASPGFPDPRLDQPEIPAGLASYRSPFGVPLVPGMAPAPIGPHWWESDALWARLGAVVTVAIGVADTWHFHQFGASGDTAFIVGGLTGLGVHVLLSTTPPR